MSPANIDAMFSCDEEVVRWEIEYLMATKADLTNEKD